MFFAFLSAVLWDARDGVLQVIRGSQPLSEKWPMNGRTPDWKVQPHGRWRRQSSVSSYGQSGQGFQPTTRTGGCPPRSYHEDCQVGSRFALGPEDQASLKRRRMVTSVPKERLVRLQTEVVHPMEETAAPDWEAEVKSCGSKWQSCKGTDCVQSGFIIPPSAVFRGGHSVGARTCSQEKGVRRRVAHRTATCGVVATNIWSSETL